MNIAPKITAFPSHGTMGEVVNEGMDLRDWFAGQELAKVDGTFICDEPYAYDRLADHCYRMADAMMRRRPA